jgi:REP-associated tyrosine transposase
MGGSLWPNGQTPAKFVQLLRESLQRYDVALHACVLIGNHYHLIAETRRANLGRWMQAIDNVNLA